MALKPSTHAGAIVDLYDRRARDWEADRAAGPPLIETAWLERFLAALPEAPEVLDAGCGSGDPIARWLISRGCRLTGVDAAPGMIDLCREKFPDQTWEVGDLRGLELGRRFMGVIAWHCLFHLTADDQRLAIAALTRHLAPGGVLMITTGAEAGEMIGEWRGEPLYHASLDAPEYRAILQGAGLVLIDHALGDEACGEATVWLAGRDVKKSPGRSRG